MRTSFLVVSVALVALAILVPSEAGCAPHGVEFAEKRAKMSKFTADKDSSSVKSSSSEDVGDFIVNKKSTITSDSDDYETASCEADEKVINTGSGQQKIKSFSSKSKSVDTEKSSKTTETKVVPDDDDCGC